MMPTRAVGGGGHWPGRPGLPGRGRTPWATSCAANARPVGPAPTISTSTEPFVMIPPYGRASPRWPVHDVVVRSHRTAAVGRAMASSAPAGRGISTAASRTSQTTDRYAHGWTTMDSCGHKRQGATSNEQGGTLSLTEGQVVDEDQDQALTRPWSVDNNRPTTTGADQRRCRSRGLPSGSLPRCPDAATLQRQVVATRRGSE
jgi:hypothetical protein